MTCSAMLRAVKASASAYDQTTIHRAGRLLHDGLLRQHRLVHVAEFHIAPILRYNILGSCSVRGGWSLREFLARANKNPRTITGTIGSLWTIATRS